jgi:hypothetical protein
MRVAKYLCRISLGIPEGSFAKFIWVLKWISSQMLKTLKKNLIDQQSQKTFFRIVADA